MVIHMTYHLQWTFQDLKPSAALLRDYKNTDDAERALNFVLPVPNWAKHDWGVWARIKAKQYLSGVISVDRIFPGRQEEILKTGDILDAGPKGLRYVFINFADGHAVQGAKMDGSHTIIFKGIQPGQVQPLLDLIGGYGDPERLSPAQFTALLDDIHAGFNLQDRYEKGRDSIRKYFYKLENGELSKVDDASDVTLGAYILDPVSASAAMWVPGPGEYLDGPTLTLQQIIGDGAFITFPGWSTAQILALSEEDYKAAFEAGKLRPKVVQADIFVNSRDNMDGSRIRVADLNPHPVDGVKAKPSDALSAHPGSF